MAKAKKKPEPDGPNWEEDLKNAVAAVKTCKDELVAIAKEQKPLDGLRAERAEKLSKFMPELHRDNKKVGPSPPAPKRKIKAPRQRLSPMSPPILA